MSKLPYRAGLSLLALAAVLLPIQAVGESGSHGSGSVMARINHAVEPFDSTKIESAYPLPVTTVRAKETYQGGTFRVLARKGEIKRFRCSSCHNDKPIRVQDGAVLTHGDIRLNHGLGRIS
ncbi:hypothetical protein GF1_09910 [Desulfolithobacter dissulfuricans]|uniref:Uncharacterized protein n=1 Tax=Desulfolithobacter dissulfuricans TaxID=2795293 RepID=A0A915U9Q4_9BACT|nr:hypothetical protein [Desulfolithobacter dissulfuricans]BCO08615.1 hypothetical protein GF1_09910 [Desulfolithobacter dissulfuricans]